MLYGPQYFMAVCLCYLEKVAIISFGSLILPLFIRVALKAVGPGSVYTILVLLSCVMLDPSSVATVWKGRNGRL